ncbi:MAG: hypothetical protein AAB691_03905 [Patescibacteria group bacterium]|mgnify:CR=1 FL=1
MKSKGFGVGVLVGVAVVILGSIYLFTPYCFLRPTIFPPDVPACQGFLSYFGYPILAIMIPLTWLGISENLAFDLSIIVLILLGGLMGKILQWFYKIVSKK